MMIRGWNKHGSSDVWQTRWSRSERQLHSWARVVTATRTALSCGGVMNVVEVWAAHNHALVGERCREGMGRTRLIRSPLTLKNRMH